MYLYRLKTDRLGLLLGNRLHVYKKSSIEVFDLFFPVESIGIISFLELQNFC